MSLANLFQWSAQIVLVALAGALVMRLMRIDVPILRHAFWRVLLVAGLALPIVQPWSTPTAGQDAATASEMMPAATIPLVTGAPAAAPSAIARVTRELAEHWLAWIGFVLAAGIAARFLWLGAGILRLHRLCKSGVSVPAGSEYDDLIGRIHASAEIRSVPRIGQPVTFGLFRPVVLVPDWFWTLDPGLRRAVLAHELWHVKRRDWGWVLIEESIRAVLWFNPAVSWVVSKVQATREEVVDELTVQCTSTRKAYLEALLVFADQPTLFPATPLARRRHLFQRMLLISREAVMSSRRAVSSFAAASAVVVATGWFGVAAFPLSADPVPVAAAAQSSPSNRSSGRAERVPSAATAAFAQTQAPPRDRRPGEPAPETAREREVRAAILADRSNRDLYFQLAELQIARGAGHDAAVTLAVIRQSSVDDIAVLTRVAQTYNRMGRFDDTVAVLQQVAALDSSNPQTQHLLATFYWEKAYKDAALTPEQRLAYIHSGIAATDKALSLNPDYVDALTYKSILLRMQANLDAANRDALLARADQLRNRAMELQRTRSGVVGGVAGGVPGGVSGGVAGGVVRREMEFVPAPGQAPPPPPPPPPPPAEAATIASPGSVPVPEFVDGVRPLRVGGEIKPPVKLRDVKPIYPPIAQSARVQGVVIIQAVIDTLGNVASASVLRGVPLLDEAALDAVRQWQFQPTTINGVVTPIVMTVTVNFAMQ